jgi:hypothetical protein
MNINKIKNYVMEDQILDWLDLYGEDKGFKKDNEFPDFDINKNFANFIKTKSEEYKKSIKFEGEESVEGSCLEDKIEQTRVYMEKGVKYIKNAVIMDKVNEIYGKCDYLVKEGGVYRVMIVQYINIKQGKKSNVLTNGNIKYYKYKLQALSRILKSYCGVRDVNEFNYIMGRNGIYKINQEESDKLLDDAIKWYKKLEKEGSNLKIDDVLLCPNMTNKNDYPWHNIKKKLAKETNEITLVHNQGPRKRKEYIDQGIRDYKKIKTTGLAAKIISINNQDGKEGEIDFVLPNKVYNNVGEWKNEEYLEFFVDFETLTKVTDKEMIFQIGCGYMSNESGDIRPKWIYKSFHVNELTDNEEKRILNEWLFYMELLKIKSRFRSEPKIFHWSHSEKTNFKKVRGKYNLKQELNWVDLLKVFREEPIVVKDALNYNLKNIARALQGNGLINTIWDGTYADGMGVMVSIILNDNIKSVEVMYDVIKYNEIDCKVLCEILSYLRINHT